MTKQSQRVSLRTLVETVLLSGDLRTGGGVGRMLEGMRLHLEAQRGQKSEIPVQGVFEGRRIKLTVHGRIDLLRDDGPLVRLTEIKTTARPLEFAGAGDEVHWAQLIGYGLLYALEKELSLCELELLYMHVGGERISLLRTMTIDQMRDYFDPLARAFLEKLDRALEHRTLRDASIQALSFPHPAYRPGQRTMMKAVYGAARERTRVAVEAPTGIGKTMAALYAALKGMRAVELEHILYLTARGTQRLAAEAALVQLREGGLCLRSVSLTAKEKCCPYDVVECSPMICPRARGFYDRLPAALDDAPEGHFGADEIAALAQKHELCPFELSLELGLLCDVMVCDYNYIIDKRVALQRMGGARRKTMLLVDEAHQLPERARDLFTAVLSDHALFDGVKAAGAHGDIKKPTAALRKAIKAFAAQADSPCLDTPPTSLQDTLAAFIAACEPLLDQAPPALVTVYFDAVFFLARLGKYAPEHRTLLEKDGRHPVITLYCADPAPELDAAFKGYHGIAFFSATLSPMEHYCRQLGGADALSIPSPFPPEHLLSLILPLDTRYTMRAKTAPQVAQALFDMVSARTGNYLACFPSYAYLEAVAMLFCQQHGHVQTIIQRRGMSEKEREAFLDALPPAPEHTTLAFVTLGGLFTEGIDLPGDRLIGAAIIGIGLPQGDLKRDVLATYFDEQGLEGYTCAYLYPALVRISQAGGRVIRSPEDRGVLLLIDHRYREDRVRDLVPPHWQLRTASPTRLPHTLRTFLENG